MPEAIKISSRIEFPRRRRPCSGLEINIGTIRNLLSAPSDKIKHTENNFATKMFPYVVLNNCCKSVNRKHA